MNTKCFRSSVVSSLEKPNFNTKYLFFSITQNCDQCSCVGSSSSVDISELIASASVAQALERQKEISQISAGDLDYSSWVRAGQTAIAFLIGFFIFSWIGSTIFPAQTPGDTMAYLQEIWERTGWTNTKLQRIEKKLGTTPRQ